MDEKNNGEWKKNIYVQYKRLEFESQDCNNAADEPASAQKGERVIWMKYRIERFGKHGLIMRYVNVGSMQFQCDEFKIYTAASS